MRRIEEIIIHCTANRVGSKITVDDIRKDHIRRGFSDIGYHYVVYANGRVEEGRPEWKQGAHCKINGHNKHSIGIAYIGGLDENGNPADTRTQEQRIIIGNLCSLLLKRYPTITKIVGHCDYDKSKKCPCFDARAEYQHLIEMHHGRKEG
jgi:N-acetyl-anhydromuramyl-L-alanine amidase AmpD